MPYNNIIGHIMLVEPFRFTILLYNVHLSGSCPYNEIVML